MAEAVAGTEIAGAYLFDRFDKPLMRIVFIGTGRNRRADVRALQKSEYDHRRNCHATRQAGSRSQKITAPPIKAALAGSKISILQPARIKDSESVI